MVPENRVLDDRRSGPLCLKTLPHVWEQIVLIFSLESDGLGSGLLSWLRIVFLTPLRKVSIFQPTRQPLAVITWSQISTSLEEYA